MENKQPNSGKMIPSVAEKVVNLEKSPKVEHLFFSNNRSILIKTSFPTDDAVALCYILIDEPTSRARIKTVTSGIEKLDEKAKTAAMSTLELMNKPLIFKGIEEVQQWFDMAKYNFDQRERAKIADFLGIRDEIE